MPEHDSLAEYACAMACYLRTLSAVAECLGETCGAVGAPYRQRIARLRARLAFEPTRESILESARTVEAELKDYAAITAQYLEQHSLELQRGMLALEDTMDSLLQGQAKYASRLRQLEEGIDPSRTLQAAELKNCIEGLTRETESVVARIREEMRNIQRRLTDAQSTDPVTGLINRREMRRQIEVHRLANTPVTLLVFEIRGPVSDQVMRQAAAKLEQRFRHCDHVGRWGDRELAVLFRGPAETAESRAGQVRQHLDGRYELDSGAHVEISASVRLAEPEAVAV